MATKDLPGSDQLRMTQLLCRGDLRIKIALVQHS